VNAPRRETSPFPRTRQIDDLTTQPPRIGPRTSRRSDA
jgi:hypothetical protein